MKIIGFLFVKINLAVALTLLLMVGSVNGQTFPEGLVGLSSNNPAVLYSIDASNGTATPFVTLNGNAGITGLSYIEGTLYGTDLYGFPGASGGFDIGSISTGGIITFLGDQNGSSNWQGLASDDCGENILYALDIENNNILTAQFPNGTVQTIGTGGDVQFVGMAYDDLNEILYAIPRNGLLYTVSTVDGTSSLIGGSVIPQPTISWGLAYDEDNSILYANNGNTGELYTLNVTTGAATLVGSNNVVETVIDGLAWLDPCGPPPSPAMVPTLSEWGLIAMAGILGIVGFIAIRRRKATA